MQSELYSIRRTNLESATFDDKLRLMSLLDIKVCPSEDLKTVCIKTRLGADLREGRSGEKHCGKVLFAPPKLSIGRTPIA